MENQKTIQQAVLKIVKRDYADDLPIVEKIPDSVWEEYEHLLDLYYSGAGAANWLEAFENALLAKGCDKRAAFLLAHLRSEEELKQFSRGIL